MVEELLRSRVGAADFSSVGPGFESRKVQHPRPFDSLVWSGLRLKLSAEAPRLIAALAPEEVMKCGSGRQQLPRRLVPPTALQDAYIPPVLSSRPVLQADALTEEDR